MHNNAAVLDKVPLRNDFQSRQGVLFHQQDGQALILIDLLQDAEDLLDQERSKPETWFIKHQQLRLGHEGPPNGKHLLLTTRQIACLRTFAFGKPRKISVDLVLFRIQR